METPSIPAAAEFDPEAEFIASKRKTGNEWELYKENVKPLKRGRKVEILNDALQSQTNNAARKDLLQTRRRMIDAIDEYKGEDHLQPWIDCIKWVQESFPTGGDCSGLVVIYEQCVRTFWHDERYKDDKRYLKVWLEYAENCMDAEVIFQFLRTNQIGQSYSAFYVAYALHMEYKKKLHTADEIFNLGIARKATPLEKLEAEYRKFLGRSMARKKKAEDALIDNHLQARSFGTILADGGAGRLPVKNAEIEKKSRKPLERIDNGKSILIYSDESTGASLSSVKSSANDPSWQSLGSRFSRNKENISLPTKWTSYKVPQKIGVRTESAKLSTPIEVFVDNDSKFEPLTNAEDDTPAALQLRNANKMNLKKETELLKENPLRYFPLCTLR
ncbi:mitotic spindle checkpoint protein BUBR1 [Phalaenopsis equestris]|uniref:mitotic spindle checkpoint protein BUBR1 n=1 Tax=Phalaenopsis equestris TaxID=78828 RepID=UPI0009E57D7C|nr:mitotic spindle checkpoint protein BUBR1 [Phalaenopsis equestris]